MNIEHVHTDTAAGSRQAAQVALRAALDALTPLDGVPQVVDPDGLDAAATAVVDLLDRVRSLFPFACDECGHGLEAGQVAGDLEGGAGRPAPALACPECGAEHRTYDPDARSAYLEALGQARGQVDRAHLLGDAVGGRSAAGDLRLVDVLADFLEDLGSPAPLFEAWAYLRCCVRDGVAIHAGQAARLEDIEDTCDAVVRAYAVEVEGVMPR